MAAEVRLDNIGVAFTATIVDEDGDAVDVSGATTQQFRFYKPDGTTVTETTGYGTTGVDGIITYTTVAGDLDVAGTWYVQPYVVTAALTLNTDVHEFEVKRNL